MKYDKDIVVKWFAEHGLDARPEFRFCPDRKWRFDFVITRKGYPDDLLTGTKAFLIDRVALEVDGGLFIAGGGRHNRGASMLKDFEKLNEAAALGWRIIRVTPDQLCMQETVDLIKRALHV